jgi:hypothetical protein
MYDKESEVDRISEELAIVHIRDWGYREEPDKLAQRFLEAKKIIAEVIRKNSQ